jgi:hypothetical protein
MRFSDLNPLGRTIIVAVAALTAGVAAVAFATSYGALYAFIKDTGLYADSGRYAARLNQAWPLLLDATFIIAQLAAILGGILRGSRGWPILTMLLTGSLTVWFNLQHAGADPGRRLAAALPPVLMILAFEIDVSIVKWVMRALGRPLESAGPLPHPGNSAGTALNSVLATQVPGSAYTEVGQSGQGTKRQIVEAYLARLGPDRAATLTAREVSADLTEEGTPVSERYVHDLLGGRSGMSRNGHGRT